MARQLKEKNENITLLQGTGYRPTMGPNSGSESQFFYQYPPSQYPTQSSS